MTKIRRSLARYRLVGSAVALAVMLAALYLPPPTRAFFCEAPMCGQGCVNWTASGGCLNCQFCCVCGEEYTCTQINDRSCELTMQ